MAVLTSSASVDRGNRELVTKWKQVIRKWPPMRKYAWLGTQEAILVLGSKTCQELRKTLEETERTVSLAVPSAAWLEAYQKQGEHQPTQKNRRDRHPHAVRLLLSRGLSRVGDEGRPSRRWTPPQAVDTEDLLDCMGDLEAKYHRAPVSPSAMAIFYLQTYSKAAVRRMSQRVRE